MKCEPSPSDNTVEEVDRGGETCVFVFVARFEGRLMKRGECAHVTRRERMKWARGSTYPARPVFEVIRGPWCLIR